MNYLIFELRPNRYGFVEGEPASLRILAHYLIDDFGYNEIRFNSWIDWLHDDQYDFTCSNITCTAKIEDDIEIYWIFDEDFSGPYFHMNKEKFIKFLHEWRDLTRQKPQTIMVTQLDDGSLRLEGKDFPKEASQ